MIFYAKMDKFLSEEVSRINGEINALKDTTTSEVLKSINDVLSYEDEFARIYLENYNGSYTELFRFNGADPTIIGSNPIVLSSLIETVPSLPTGTVVGFNPIANNTNNTRFMLRVCKIYYSVKSLTGSDVLEFMRPELYHNNYTQVVSDGILKDWVIKLERKGTHVSFYVYIDDAHLERRLRGRDFKSIIDRFGFYFGQNAHKSWENILMRRLTEILN